MILVFVGVNDVKSGLVGGLGKPGFKIEIERVRKPQQNI